LRARLLGSGVLGSDDLAIAELVFDELADEVVIERLGKFLGGLGKRDLHPLMQVVPSGEEAVRKLVETRVLEVPNGACLTDQFAVETVDARFFADDLRVLDNLALGCCAFFVGHVGWQGELRDFTTHVAR
jgi:hypothetical protein